MSGKTPLIYKGLSLLAQIDNSLETTDKQNTWSIRIPRRTRICRLIFVFSVLHIKIIHFLSKQPHIIIS